MARMSTTSAAVTVADKIATREAKVGIIGLGYAGLPLALAFAEAGFDVTGIDLSSERVSAVNERRSYLVDVPVERYGNVEGELVATDDYAAVEELDALTICVPTPLSKTRTPDLGFVVKAAESLAEHLRPGQLIILQSTTYPGTTEEVIVPVLERDGLRVGQDFYVGYAPERVDPGNKKWNLRNTPKIVSGMTPECRDRTQQLYATVVDDIVPVSSTSVAETTKLHENTFRQVNIALANELALMCDRIGINAWEVIEAAATKPFAFLPHYPGPGLGGDCIPVVPHFLTWRLREYGYSTRLIDAAHEVNTQMPLHVIQKIADALNDQSRAIKNSRILLLGMAYKADVHDTRESPSLEIYNQLKARGADVRFCDPWVPTVDFGDEHVESVGWTREECEQADCVVMLTPHSQFLSDPHWESASLLVDTRNALPDGSHIWKI
jgi:UDP-N-acetyl-D-glucosamine dehydrogenase